MLGKIIRIPLLLLILLAFKLVADLPVFDISQVSEQGLTQVQAEAVLVVALKHEQYKIFLPGAYIEALGCCGKGPLIYERYFDFGVGFDSATAGATEIWGLFVVSKKLGIYGR